MKKPKKKLSEMTVEERLSIRPNMDDIINSKTNYDPITRLHSLTFSPNKEASNRKLFITKDKKSGEYQYKGVLLKMSEDATYRIVFDCLFDFAQNGGFVFYEVLGAEIERRIPSKKRLSKVEMNKFIREKLGEHNGFLGYAKIRGKKIPTMNPGGKDLIEIKRGKGIQFNNNM